ncbi:MAG: DUF1549 and DUF1553 domain-containing protein [Pirellulales bacterium]
MKHRRWRSVFEGSGPRTAARTAAFALTFATALAAASASLPVESAADEPRLRDVIDAEIEATWPREKVAPAPPTTDAEFLRRVSLDLIGVVPTPDEAVAFLDDGAADKRERLIERLLTDPRYARHQADLWDVILFSRHPPGYETDKRDGIQHWLREQFSQNVPYDQMVRSLLKAEGNSAEDGPPLFYAQYRNQPEDASEVVSQTFLGVQLQCARCHDHPFESWTQLDFYGMAAFLARVQIVSLGKKDDLTKFVVAEKSTGDILFTGPAKDQQAGKKGEPVKPKFLLGEPLAEPSTPEGFKEPKFEDNKLPPKPHFSRKDQLAEWIARPDNPFFARAIANRLWAQYLGRGLVHPIDNMSPSNAPSHPELLEKLAAALVAQKFDLRWFTRELVSSRAYQRSSRGAASDPQPRWYEYARTRPLSAEELIDSWRAAAWYDEVEKQANKAPGKNRFQPIERDYMIRFFGTPNSGAGDFQGGLHEHLFLNNGPLSVLLSGKGGLVDWLQSSSDSVEKKIERLYLSVLTRRPTADETARAATFLAEGDGKQPRWQDVAWALMTCSEFRFNH